MKNLNEEELALIEKVIANEASDTEKSLFDAKMNDDQAFAAGFKLM